MMLELYKLVCKHSDICAVQGQSSLMRLIVSVRSTKHALIRDMCLITRKYDMSCFLVTYSIIFNYNSVFGDGRFNYPPKELSQGVSTGFICGKGKF